MSPFLVILLSIPLLSLLWYGWAMRTGTLRAAGRGVRIAFSLATALLLVGFLWILLHRTDRLAVVPPGPVQALVLLWGLVFLPFLALPSLVIGGLAQGVRHRRQGQEAPAARSDRRRFLATTSLALPLLATYGATAISIPQVRHFRIREIDVPLADLPPDLDGVVIAHVSDVHVGKFTSGDILTDLAAATNSLKPDLVALTGDLIDHALADLPEALEMLARIDFPCFLVEGNHDLFEGPEAFARGVQAAGLPLLRNAAAHLEVRGHPLDLLGIRWSRSETRMARDITAAGELRRSDAWPILLAHHPHAFDAAAAARIPLTLGGHTHGGQLMLTPEIGPGPAMYRYWSGLYRKPSGHAAVISNGAGNWFPLRTAAPAEIIRLQLRRA